LGVRAISEDVNFARMVFGVPLEVAKQFKDRKKLGVGNGYVSEWT